MICVSVFKNQKYQTARQQTPTEFRKYIWEVILNPYAIKHMEEYIQDIVLYFDKP